MSALSNIDFDEVNEGELKTLCEQYKLSTEGGKSDFIRRLKRFVEHQSSVNMIIRGGKATGSTQSGEPATDNALVNDLTEIIRTLSERNTTEFSFKDIEESIPKFSGASGKNITRWLNDYEETITQFQWSEERKFVYAKRLLSGNAKLFVQCEAKPRNYAQLKKALLEEFGATISAALVHKQLSETRKKTNESYREYLYRIMEVAAQAHLGDDSIIVYAVDGSPGTPHEKSNLYEAKTIKELKLKFDTYERIREKSEQLDKSEKKSTDKKKPTSSGISHKRYCYSCGESTHEVDSCPNKDKGPKCFRCNNYGHKSNECKNKPEAKTKNDDTKKGDASKTSINVLQQRSVYKDVVINGKNFVALIDTGADITVIRKDIFINNQLANYEKTNIKVNGIGNTIETFGVFNATIAIDESEFMVKCYIVSEEFIEPEVIVGWNLLSQAVTEISLNSITIKKIDTAETSTKANIINDQLANVMYITEEESSLPDISHITDAQTTNEIKSLIKNYSPSAKKPCPIELKIILMDEVPVRQRARRLPPIEKAEVDRQVAEWLENGIVQPSCSDYASPVVLADKKDGSKRLCIDFRNLNKKIYKDNYPLPIIDDQIDLLQKAQIFSTLDLANGFFHVPVEEKSRKYTAFVTPSAQYEFLRVPFGLCVSPPTFQRFINTIFCRQIQSGFVLVYMDDLIIPAETIDEAVVRLKEVLQVAAENNLQIKWKKCQLLHTKIDFLGYEIENGTIRSSPLKTKAVKTFPEPKTVQQLQSFLGLAGYFRKFIKDFAAIARPLSEQLKKSKTFHFGDEQRATFELLKEKICERPVLTIFRYGADTELHTDASKHAFGAILMQRNFDDGEMHPVRYLSIKTSETEQKYHSYELEVLAVVNAVNKFRVYLLGQHFKIITDCKAFTTTMNKKDIPKVARWAMILQHYDYEIVHRAAERMKHVDALSRIHLMHTATVTEQLRAAQNTDEHIKAIMEILKEKPYEDYISRNGLLCKEISGNINVVVPEKMQYGIIKKAHDMGHFKSQKLVDIINKEFYIPKLQSKLTEVTQNCIECILTEKKAGKQEGLLHPIPKDETPLDTWHLDHLGPMPSTKKQYNYLLTIVDAFTKFVWIFPTKTTTAAETISKLTVVTNVFGNPRRIITDRGTAFTADAFKEHCGSEKIETVLTTTGVPRGNGQVERMHRVIIAVLSKLSFDDPEKWFQKVETVQIYMNKTYQRSIKTSPFELMFGIPMKTKDDLKIADIIESEMISEFQMERQQQRLEAKAQIEKIQQENKQTFDAKRKKATQYAVGDLVAIARTQFGTGMKLRPKFFGPYAVINAKGNDRYNVKKIGEHGGPGMTTSSADHMKKWSEI